MKSLELRILGPLEAIADGRPARLGAPKQRTVLAMLLTSRGSVVSRERLVDALWGDEPPASAVQSLQVYVHGLRRALGSERLETAGAGYRAVFEEGELDLDRFERALERGRRSLEQGDAEHAAAEVRHALELWRGPALADLPAEARATAGAERLEELRLAALELRNDAELACGRHQELVAELDALVAEHPFRERFLEQRALALYRSGRQKEALDACREARRTLVDELGLEPSAALRELERAILRQDESLAAPASEPHAKPPLPVAPTPLVGRLLEVAAVTALFRDEGARLVTLTGPGGTGKTRLALAVAEALAPELRDGALFVDLAPVATPELVLPTIAEALGCERATGRSQAAVAEHLRRAAAAARARQLRAAPGRGAGRRRAARGARRGCSSWRRAARRCASRPSTSTRSRRSRCPTRSVPFETLVRHDAVRLFSTRARAVDACVPARRRGGAARSPRSAAGSTGCRWRSSSLPRARSCSLPRRCSSALTASRSC